MERRLMSRRALLAEAGLLAGSTMLLAACGGASGGGAGGGGSFTAVTWGGATTTGLEQSWGELFEERSKAQLQVVAPVDYGKWEAQIRAGRVTWDWIDAEAWFVHGFPELVQPIDHERLGVEASDMLDTPNAFLPKAIGSYQVAYVIAYQSDKKAHPRNWEEFFDLDAIPGKRSLYNWPYGTLEIALLADGVPFDQLYPLDVDRAFKKLDTIRDDLLFWNTGAESEQYLASGAVDFIVPWSNRVSYLGRDGVPVAIEWAENLQIWDHHLIPRGTPVEDLSYDFIGAALDPVAQAKMAELTGVSPSRKAAYKHVKEDTAAWLSGTPANAEKAVGAIDAEWWGANLDAVSKQWYAWVGG